MMLQKLPQRCRAIWPILWIRRGRRYWNAGSARNRFRPGIDSRAERSARTEAER